jgi:hypothetical protein
MARARSIKPGFFRNEQLAELPFGCGSAQYILIPKWNLHQNPGIKEAKGAIPAPDQHGARLASKTVKTLCLRPVTSSDYTRCWSQSARSGMDRKAPG